MLHYINKSKKRYDMIITRVIVPVHICNLFYFQFKCKLAKLFFTSDLSQKKFFYSSFFFTAPASNFNKSNLFFLHLNLIESIIN